MRGWIVKPLRAVDGERRLVVACIVQALQDARRGDKAAWQWLETTGRRWCEILGIEAVGDWPAAAARLETCRRELTGGLEHQRAGDRERAMRSYYKRKAERVQDRA